MGIFSIPTGLSSEATHMIGELLQEDQHRRPTADQCLRLDFIHGFLLPKSLPVYCLLKEPRVEDIPFDDGEQLAGLQALRNLFSIRIFCRRKFRQFLQTRRSSSSPSSFHVWRMPRTKLERYRCIVSTFGQSDRFQQSPLHFKSKQKIIFR